MFDTEQELIDACLAGSPEAWAHFKVQYQRLIRATAARVSAVDDATLEDLEATVYQKLLEDRCRRMRAWKGRAKFSTYLVQVTRNLVLDWVDAQRRTLNTISLDERMDVAGETNERETEEVMQEQIAVMREAIAALPERQAVIMRLRLEGKTLREIAQLLKRPTGTISVESSRAMEKVRNMLLQSPAFAAQGVGS